MGASRKCIVLQCVNNYCDKKNKTSSFHELPSDEKQRKKWLKQLKPYMDPYDQRELITVCGNHFEKKYFKQSKKKILTRDAVPTIFTGKKSRSLVTSSDKKEHQSVPKLPKDGVDSASKVDESEETCNNPHLPIPVKEEPECKYVFNSVKIYKESGKTELCRVCFRSAPTHKKLTERHVTRTETYKEMMEFLSLDINLDFYPEPVICINCVMHLLNAFDFKKKCQRTEKTLNKYYSNRSSDEKPINLLIVAYRENSDHVTLKNDAILTDHDYDRKTEYVEEIQVEKKTNSGETRFKRGTAWGDPPYLCEVCGKTFQNHIQCRRHLREHKIQKETVESYFCEICQCSYANINVQIHMNSHRVKKFECEVCGRRFSRSNLLVNHVQDVHRKAAYVFCSMCGKTCLRKQLTAHMARHSDKKDAKCHICDRMVYRLRLRQHIRAHFQSKSTTVCHICGKSVVRYLMTSHLKSHDRNRKFKCTVCDVGFFTQKKLQVHTGGKKHLRNLMLQEVARKSEQTG